MEFTVVSKVTYRVKDGIELKNLMDFQDGVKNGDIEMQVHDLELLDSDGDSVVNGADTPELFKEFIEVLKGEDIEVNLHVVE
jgi:hypothetical protein